MYMANFGILTIVEFAGAQNELLLCRTLQTKDRGGVDIVATQLTRINCQSAFVA